MNPRHQAAGYTLVELIVVMAIVATLISLAFPAFQAVRDQMGGIKSLGAARRIYEGAAHVYASAGADAPGSPSTDMTWWRDQLLRYQISPSQWFCPPREPKDKSDVSDYMCMGVLYSDFFTAEDKSELYLFMQRGGDIKKGMIVIMADGAVKLDTTLVGD